MIEFTVPFSDNPIYLNPPFEAVRKGYATASPDPKTGDIEYMDATIIYINGNQFTVKESVEEVMEQYYE